jgi:hypothetical protein
MRFMLQATEREAYTLTTTHLMIDYTRIGENRAR